MKLSIHVTPTDRASQRSNQVGLDGTACVPRKEYIIRTDRIEQGARSRTSDGYRHPDHESSRDSTAAFALPQPAHRHESPEESSAMMRYCRQPFALSRGPVVQLNSIVPSPC